MSEIKNPFIPIYHKVNNGTNIEKYNKLYIDGGGGRITYRYISMWS